MRRGMLLGLVVAWVVGFGASWLAYGKAPAGATSRPAVKSGTVRTAAPKSAAKSPARSSPAKKSAATKASPTPTPKKATTAKIIDVAGDAREDREGLTRYYVVMMDGQKLGYMQEYRRVRADGVYSSMTMKFALARMGTPMYVSMQEANLETHDGKPIKAKDTLNLSVINRVVEVQFGQNNQATAVVDEGGRKRTQTIDCPPDLVLSEGSRLLAKQKGLAEGTAYEFSVFEPTSLKPVKVSVRIGPKATVDVLGRQMELTEMTTTTMGSQQLSYVDDQCEMIKSTVDVAGMRMEVLAATRAAALSEYQPAEMMEKMLLSVPKRLEGAASAKSARFTLKPKDPAKPLNFPQTDFQDVQVQPDGNVVVTVKAVSFPHNLPLKPLDDDADPAVRDATKPNGYLQSDDPAVIRHARQAVGKARTTEQACRNLQKFVDEYIQKKDMSVGYASASEVLKTRQGDCTEHAVLLAALCRAVGIPAKVVVGLMYVELDEGSPGVMGGHAWVCVWSGGRWIPLDASMPYDVSHLALSVTDGQVSDFMTEMLDTLGQFEVQDVQLQQ